MPDQRSLIDNGGQREQEQLAIALQPTYSSWPGLTRPSTNKGVDTRHKAGHDVQKFPVQQRDAKRARRASGRCVRHGRISIGVPSGTASQIFTIATLPTEMHP